MCISGLTERQLNFIQKEFKEIIGLDKKFYETIMQVESTKKRDLLPNTEQQIDKLISFLTKIYFMLMQHAEKESTEFKTLVAIKQRENLDLINIFRIFGSGALDAAVKPAEKIAQLLGDLGYKLNECIYDCTQPIFAHGKEIIFYIRDNNQIVLAKSSKIEMLSSEYRFYKYLGELLAKNFRINRSRAFELVTKHHGL